MPLAGPAERGEAIAVEQLQVLGLLEGPSQRAGGRGGRQVEEGAGGTGGGNASVDPHVGRVEPSPVDDQAVPPGATPRSCQMDGCPVDGQLVEQQDALKLSRAPVAERRARAGSEDGGQPERVEVESPCPTA